MNASENVIATMHTSSSNDILDMMEKIKAMPFVKDVHFSELIEIVDERSIEMKYVLTM